MALMLSDDEIVGLYREWSENTYPEFITPNEEAVRDFRAWLIEKQTHDDSSEALAPYELILLAEYRRQTKEVTT